ncbi:helix-turn-helix domain-containing protein [Parasegetibacter sp. NRK P23]|uniref:helix-turn-helix domain-containing protein n=1 Tax=Parasegetibacter sp. NRK P23 TaxID=2942999 RepID=UPI0020441A76|nr:helix-turn-helix transcriptional regulator [Parasegetibacter sp. NRK P23]MCM5528953.1 helix-turn-helix transcriptional regulator [Parasegetibacter sp. NRK P23]
MKKHYAEQHLSKRLKELRHSAGLTQLQVAEKLGIGVKRYAAWEEGRAEPPIGYLVEISTFYKVSLDCILISKQTITI